MDPIHPVNNSNIQRRLAYTRVEAAKLLGVSPISIDRLAARGVLRPSRALRRPLYREDELLRFLTESASPRTGKETSH